MLSKPDHPAPEGKTMADKVDVLAVLDRFANVVLPVELWNGSNPYCSPPGREGSKYATDLKALCEARAAVAELIEAASEFVREDSCESLDEVSNQFDRLSAAVARIGGAA